MSAPVPPFRPLIRPSRLNVMADVPEVPSTKVSLPVKAGCTRSTEAEFCAALGAEDTTGNTTQPVCQPVLFEQLRPSEDTHMVTFWPSLTASARANCRSPSSPLISPEMRFDVSMLRKDGTPTPARIATMTITTSSSTRVNPAPREALRRRKGAIGDGDRWFMGGTLG